MTIPPINMRWNGESFVPVSAHEKLEADKHLIIGWIYRLVEEHGRSAATHNHEFAFVDEAWRNLPENLADQFPTAEHLRKHALIKCGFSTHRQIVASSKAQAIRLAAFMRPTDDYAIYSVTGCVVDEWKAISQSRRAMDARQFQESKQAVLEYVASLIGVEPETLAKEAGRAA